MDDTKKQNETTDVAGLTGEVTTPTEVTASDVVALANQDAVANKVTAKPRKNKLHKFDYEDADTGEVFHIVVVYPGIRAARKLLAESKNQLGVLDSDEYAKRLLALVVAPKSPKIDDDFFDEHGGYNTIIAEIDTFFSAQLNWTTKRSANSAASRRGFYLPLSRAARRRYQRAGRKRNDGRATTLHANGKNGRRHW